MSTYLHRFLSGFRIVVDAAGLITRSPRLLRLALAGTALHVSWILFVMAGGWGRLLAFNRSEPWAVGFVVPIGLFVWILGFPVLGPIASVIRLRAAEHTCALAEKREPPPRDARWWATRVRADLFPGLVVRGVSVMVAAVVIGKLIPGAPSPLQTAVLALVTVTALVLFFLWGVEQLSALHIRGRLPELAGFVAGSWCLTLFGAGPWLTPLLAVASVLFLLRIDPSAGSRTRQDGSIPVGPYERVDLKILRRIEQTCERLNKSIAWTPVPPDTTEMRLEALWLQRDRAGNGGLAALVPTDAHGRVHRRSARQFWLMRTRVPGPFEYRRMPWDAQFAGPFKVGRQLESPSGRDVSFHFLRGFMAFIEAARLIVRSPPLSRLTLAGGIAHVAWIWIVLIFAEGMSNRRWVALGTDLPLAIHILVGVAGVLILLLCFPGIGPIAAAIRIRAAEYTRALTETGRPPRRDALWWSEIIVQQLFYMFPRLIAQGIVLAAVTLITGAAFPGGPSALQLIAQSIAGLTVLALLTLIALEQSRGEVLELLRGRWPDIAGYVVGAWCLTLFGLAPWLSTLLAVAAESLVSRIDPPAVSTAPAPKVQFVRFDPEIVERVWRSYERLVERLGDNIQWTHAPPAPRNMRLEAITIRADRIGEEQLLALVPTDKLGRVHAESARQFWLLRTMHTGPFYYRAMPVGEFAGPFRIEE